MLKELGRLCEKKLNMGFMFLAHQLLTMTEKCCIFV
jgi:hypothetical protein